MIRLIIYFKDGSELSGTYHWADALAKLKIAAVQLSFLDFHFEAPCA